MTSPPPLVNHLAEPALIQATTSATEFPGGDWDVTPPASRPRTNGGSRDGSLSARRLPSLVTMYTDKPDILVNTGTDLIVTVRLSLAFVTAV